MNGILTWFDFNSCHSSFRNLRIILSDLRFYNTFHFVKYGASAQFFISERLSAQNEVNEPCNELLPVNSLLFVAAK